MFKTRAELRQSMCDAYLTHDSIAKTAHAIWIEDGCPDGEEMHRGMRIKELHWMMATMRLEIMVEFDTDTYWGMLMMTNAMRPQRKPERWKINGIYWKVG